MITFIVGVVVGALIGVTITALCAASYRGEDE